MSYEITLKFKSETEARMLRRVLEDPAILSIAIQHFAQEVVEEVVEQLPPEAKEKE